MDTDMIDYSGCSFDLKEFFKKIFTREELRAEASDLLRERFVLES